jgi:hypothetical protein
MAKGLSVGREPEVKPFNRFVVTAKPRRVAVSDSFLASALQVPALLPTLVSYIDWFVLTIVDCERRSIRVGLGCLILLRLGSWCL